MTTKVYLNFFKYFQLVNPLFAKLTVTRNDLFTCSFKIKIFLRQYLSISKVKYKFQVISNLYQNVIIYFCVDGDELMIWVDVSVLTESLVFVLLLSTCFIFLKYFLYFHFLYSSPTYYYILIFLYIYIYIYIAFLYAVIVTLFPWDIYVYIYKYILLCYFISLK